MTAKLVRCDHSGGFAGAVSRRSLHESGRRQLPTLAGRQHRQSRMRLELLVGPPPRTTLLCRQSPQGNLAAQQVENGNARYRDQRRALPGTFLEQGESLLGNGGFGARAESNGSQHKQPRRVC